MLHAFHTLNVFLIADVSHHVPVLLIFKASKIVKQGLSVRATENLVKQYLAGYKKNNSKNSPKDPNISRLENDLSQRLAAKVSIAHQSTGRGKLQINYNSLAELEGILKRLD